MALTWFRMYSEFANDPKVQMMPEHMQRRLVMLFCLRCSNGDVTLHETEIAFSMRISESELLETKTLFLEKKFINKNWKILNWEKRQFSSDSSASRVKAWRDKRRNVTETLHEQKCNALDTEQIQNRTDTEKNKEKKTRILEHVFLTASEYKKLIDRLGEEKTDEYIERLNNYIGSKGKKYKSHYHTILNWIDSDSKKNKKSSTGFDAAGNPLKVLV